MNRSVRTAVAAACAAGLLLGAGPALARDGGDEIRRSGDCSGRTDWELTAKARDRGVEIEFEVDAVRSGQLWRYRLRHNAVLFAAGLRTTRPPSGSFTVERWQPNLAGVDTFTAVARNVRTGEICRAALRF